MLAPHPSTHQSFQYYVKRMKSIYAQQRWDILQAIHYNVHALIIMTTSEPRAIAAPVHPPIHQGVLKTEGRCLQPRDICNMCKIERVSKSNTLNN